MAEVVIVDEPIVLLDENRETAFVDGLTCHRIKAGRPGNGVGLRNAPDSLHPETLEMIFQSLQILHDEERFDLFHAFSLYPGGFITGILSKAAGVPSIIAIVGDDLSRCLFSPELLGVCRSGLDNADRIVTPGLDVLTRADAMAPVKQKGRVIYGSVEVPPLAQEKRQRRKPFRVGSAGVFSRAKGLPYLLKAVAYVKAQSSLALDLAGTVTESEKDVYEEMVIRTGVGDVLTLRSPLRIEETRTWFASLDLFILPSISEDCPQVLLEAMAAGLPCVASRTGVVGEIIEDGVSGILVPFGDAMALVNALEQVISMPDGGLRFGAAARERALLFSPARESQAWQTLYSELLNS
ncbi:MAG: glycosyltransferase family 4 protein [Chitinivibrionia bacterium]|nr:glycosyltransferase family 4 protein [Chitinivibrionia bacterium]